MIKSMTGFGSRQGRIGGVGKISVEIRSFNHKFLDTIVHVPEGFLSLEEDIKKQIHSKIKRGRITCTVNIVDSAASRVFINKELLKNYLKTLGDIKKEFHTNDTLSINNLIHLPGVLSLTQGVILKPKIWPNLKRLVNAATDDLERMRQKEGRALYVYLKNRTEALKINLRIIKTRSKIVIKAKLGYLESDEERSSFLKNTDITEEMERLAFHSSNFIHKLSGEGPVGKELDFIAQEMQREINTIGAKCPDKIISTQVVEIKSQIEKLREQVQNIE
jgi:uncharacterized protein (TIGR00255 family)